jgi:hypothetical protein
MWDVLFISLSPEVCHWNEDITISGTIFSWNAVIVGIMQVVNLISFLCWIELIDC